MAEELNGLHFGQFQKYMEKTEEFIQVGIPLSKEVGEEPEPKHRI